VAVNCGGIPVDLFEAEMFGHERGAFTDARERKAGCFEQARGGSLFLDEVGELRLEAQAKLLRVLQDQRVRRLGAKGEIPIDARILSATNIDLPATVAAGAFRSDLYYRLNALSLFLPPLRERGDDISLLIDHFVEHCRLAVRPDAWVSPMARTVLTTYSWPGNVRQLEHVLVQAIVRARTGAVLREHLPAEISGAPHQGRGADLRRPQGTRLYPWLYQVTDALRRQEILAELSAHQGNRSRAASSLGINRRSLFKMMHRLGIRPRAF
jgi:DNA-binding NtrC family response regulator